MRLQLPLLKPINSIWLARLIALLAGAMVTLSLAPFNLWPLGIVSITLLSWLLDNCSILEGTKRGWFYGLGLFGSGISWVYVSIHVYGYAPVPLAAFLTLLFSAGLALLAALMSYAYLRWIRDLQEGKLLGFAALIVLSEWLRSWFLTGFPWLYLGYAHIETPLAGWAPIGGVWSVSLVTAYTGAVIAQCLSLPSLNKGIRIHLAALAALWFLGTLFTSVQWVVPADRAALKIAMVQTNISQHIKWDPDNYSNTLNLYRDGSAGLWDSHDIVIWPEAAIPGYYHNARDFLNSVGSQASEHQATLITGIPIYERIDNRGHSYNGIMAFGNGSGSYRKQRLVPFGEYIPLENLLRGLIKFFDLPMSAFSPGDAFQQGLTAGDIRLAPFICYEIVYPGLLGDWLPDTDILLTISNDAWFGDSIGPLQHLQMAQMRALEAGRYLLRSTGSGVSAIIDQRGRIVTSSRQFKAEILSGEATVYTGQTPVARFGTWPVIALCVFICLFLKFFDKRSRSESSQ